MTIPFVEYTCKSLCTTYHYYLILLYSKCHSSRVIKIEKKEGTVSRWHEKEE